MRAFGFCKLSEHAYGRSPKLSRELSLALNMMLHRLDSGKPRVISAKPLAQWLVYTDAAYEPETKSAGLGAALFNDMGACLGWFGVPLDKEQCAIFGAMEKPTTIYELELLASILALDVWASSKNTGLQVCFGDNNGARFSLIRGSCLRRPAARLMEYHLLREAENNLCTWFARAPTEADISDYRSRNMPQALLELKLDESAAASIWFDSLANTLKLGQAERSGECRQPGPTCKKGALRLPSTPVANA